MLVFAYFESKFYNVFSIEIAIVCQNFQEMTFILKNALSHVYVLHQKLQSKMKSIINI